jgi:ABC-type microcin C transport system duplicated ATPase subunit YejF
LIVHDKNSRLFSLGGSAVRAVNRVSMSLQREQMMGIIDESGSGKCSLLSALWKFIIIQAYCICMEEIDVTGFSDRELFPYRRKIQMIPQDFCNIFNRTMTIKKC